MSDRVVKRVSSPLRESAVLSAGGFVDRLGRDRIHGNVPRAVEAHIAAMR